MTSPTFDISGLTGPQQRIFISNTRFRVVPAGRRFGKTVHSITEAIYEGQTGDEKLIWYIAPTYKMAKEILWEDLKKAVNYVDMIASKNESELWLKLAGFNSKIYLKGADNPDSLRGKGLDFAIFDEAADIKKSVWETSVRPALADKRGKALFIGSPKGYNWFYDIYMDGLDPNKPEWESFLFTTAQGGNVDISEINEARRTMSKKHFDQEFRASFETLANRVYFSFDRRYNVDDSVADLGGEVHVGMDFNISPMSATLSSKCGDQLHTFDEIGIMSDSNTEEMAREIRQRYPKRRIIVYPDPSGKSRKTSAVAGRTDFSILRSFGFEVVAPNRAPLVVDRVNEVNALMCNSKGDRRAFIHPRCKNLIKGLEGQTYKEGTSQPDKSLGLDHFPDGYGYKVHMMFPINISKVNQVEILGL